MRLPSLGPVFDFEMLLAARKKQQYAARVLFATLLFAGLAACWLTIDVSQRGAAMTLRQRAELGQSFFGTLAFLELSLVLLAAPALTAGAICVVSVRVKRRGKSSPRVG